MKIGIITGTGLYELPGLKNAASHSIKTPFGDTRVIEFERDQQKVYHIARHGTNHVNLPNMINYRANMYALHSLGVKFVIGTSVMGIVDEKIPLARLLFFNDLYYPDNRLPSGEMCTIYTEPGDASRGHYIFGSPFSQNGNQIAMESADALGISSSQGLTYAYSCGPRFNSRAEIRSMINAGASAVSQTAGPEIILAGELEIGYLLLGFGVDYANGVREIPTSVEELNENLVESKGVFTSIIDAVLPRITNDNLFDNGFVYRFN